MAGRTLKKPFRTPIDLDQCAAAQALRDSLMAKRLAFATDAIEVDLPSVALHADSRTKVCYPVRNRRSNVRWESRGNGGSWPNVEVGG